MASGKKLYKKTSEKKICGVCAGLAEYLNIDVTVVRVLFVLLSLFTTGFPGLLVYVIMALVMPDEDDIQPPYDTTAWISNSIGSPVFSRGAFYLQKTAENRKKICLNV